MNRHLYTTIEEWAGDNSITINEEQINELADAVEICSEIDISSNGFILENNQKSEKDIEIDNLKEQLHTLKMFINSKGINISYGKKYVTEHYMESISDSHAASRERTIYF